MIVTYIQLLKTKTSCNLLFRTNYSIWEVHMVSPQTVFTYPFSPCKATNLTTWCHRKQSLLILFHHAKLQILLHDKQSLLILFHHAKLQILLHGVTANSATWCHCKQSLLILFHHAQSVFTYPYLLQTVFTYPFSPCKATNLTTWCHCKQSLLILFHHAKLQILLHGVTANSLYLSFFTMQSYKSYYMLSPQTVFTYPFSQCKATNLTTWCHCKQSLLILFHHAKLQILLHGVTANSLYLSFFTMQSYKSDYMVSLQTVFTYPFSPCKATNLTTWCHCKQSLLILFHHAKLQILQHGVTANRLYLNPFHHAKLQILLHGVTANSLYLSFFTMQSYKSYYMVSPQTVFTYPFHHVKLQILLHGVTANSLYLSFFTMQSYKSYYMVSLQTVFTYPFSPCKATNLTTWCHRKQSLLIRFTMLSYKSYYMVSLQTVFTYPFSQCKATNLTYPVHVRHIIFFPVPRTGLF